MVTMNFEVLPTLTGSSSVSDHFRTNAHECHGFAFSGKSARRCRAAFRARVRLRLNTILKGNVFRPKYVRSRMRLLIITAQARSSRFCDICWQVFATDKNGNIEWASTTHEATATITTVIFNLSNSSHCLSSERIPTMCNAFPIVDCCCDFLPSHNDNYIFHIPSGAEFCHQSFRTR